MKPSHRKHLALAAGGGPRTGAGVPTALGEAPRGLDWSILMARSQAGDKVAYRRLLEEVAPYLRALAFERLRDRRDAEDAVQEALLTVHALRHTYDPARPFGPWLTTIAKRRIVDALRRRGRIRVRETALEAEHETFAGPEANQAEAASDAYILREALERLPAGQRRAVRLLKLQEMTLQEAAVASGKSVAALKVLSHRAIKNLRRLLARGSRPQ